MADDPTDNDDDFGKKLPGQADQPDPDSVEGMYRTSNPSFDKDDKDEPLGIIDSDGIDENPDFYRNLAETLPDTVLSEISSALLDLIEEDKEARKRRDDDYAETLKRAGLGHDAPGGAEFEGASRATHPMLTKAAVDFSSTIMKEIFPRTSGMVKDNIIGTTTEQKIEKAKRKSRYMNWQVTQQMPEFRGELETLMTQVPMAGVQYLKMHYDMHLRRIKPLFVPADDLLIPYTATSFFAADRTTEVQHITGLEFKRRIESKMYRDINYGLPHQPDRTAAAAANEPIEGKNESGLNEDDERIVYEITTYYELEDGRTSSYLISIDETSREVAAVYRNWDIDDDDRIRLDWIVDFPFVPWRGAAPIGLMQLIGGLSIAATGALRALLDSAHVNNIPTALKLKGAGGKGAQTVKMRVGEIVELEGSAMADDIRKVTMPMPFNPPNSTLFQLLGFLVDAGESVVQTVMKELVNENTEMPVGTTLLLIEQGMKVFSAIHGRIHDSMGRLLKILHRLNKMHLKETTVIDKTGELTVRREDFEGPIDVVPVSDPNIFSDTQRFAFMQMLSQRAQMYPGLYDLRSIEEWILQNSRIPDATRFLTPKPQAHNLNAVNENLAATVGRPVIAFPEQDHLAHLQIHLDFLGSSMLGQHILVGPIATPILLSHLKEHMVFYYGNRIYEVVSAAMGKDASDVMKMKDDEVNKQLEQLLAMASQIVTKELDQTFSGVGQVVQMAMQFMQQIQPKKPDPLDIAKQEADAKTSQAASQQQMNQARSQMDQARLVQDQQRTQADLSKTQAETQGDILQAQSDRETNVVNMRVDQQRMLLGHQEALAETVQKHRAEALRSAVDNARLAMDMARARQDNATKLMIAAHNNATALRVASMQPKGNSNG